MATFVERALTPVRDNAGREHDDVMAPAVELGVFLLPGLDAPSLAGNPGQRLLRPRRRGAGKKTGPASASPRWPRSCATSPTWPTAATPCRIPAPTTARPRPGSATKPPHCAGSRLGFAEIAPDAAAEEHVDDDCNAQ
jgi:hypothetical protein